MIRIKNHNILKKFRASFKSWASVKKVHRLIRFKEKAWLKEYINMNTGLRKAAKTDFEKTFSNRQIIQKSMEDFSKTKGH